MALPDVIIQIANGSLGALLAIADGVAGYVLTGVTNGDIVQGTPIQITSLEDAAAKGLASATNPFAYKVVKEHYDQAPGTEIYLMLVSPAMTVNLMADKTNANGARKLLDFAQGNVRLLTVINDPTGLTPTITNGLDANVATAKTNLQALAVEYAGGTKQAPFWGFVGGTHFSGTAASLTDQNNSSDDYVSIIIGDTVPGNGCAVGVIVGRLAANPVQRKASRVKTGALVIPGQAMYIGTTLVDQYTSIATIHDRGYITFRKFPKKNGYYAANDFTCTSSASDFKIGARRRVMNKLQILAYAIYVEEVDDEILVDASGNIDAPYAVYLEDVGERQIKPIMVATKEISDFKAFVDPNQKPLQANATNIVLGATPVGYNTMIYTKLTYVNPAL